MGLCVLLLTDIRYIDGVIDVSAQRLFVDRR
jgi:hypothetical protein